MVRYFLPYLLFIPYKHYNHPLQDVVNIFFTNKYISMDCCGKRKTKVSPVRTPPPKKLKGDSSRNLRVALEEYRISHPNTLIVDSPSFGLDRRELIDWNYERGD